MKKIVSLVLCLLLIISTIVFGITTVSASTNDDFEYCSTKLDKSLLDNLLALESDDYIQVSLWLSYESQSEQEIRELIFNECGLTEKDLEVDKSKFNSDEEAREEELRINQIYIQTKRKINKNYHSSKNKEILEKLGLPYNDFIYVSIFTPYCVGIELSKSRIFELSLSDDIELIENDTSAIKNDYPTGKLFYENFLDTFNLRESGCYSYDEIYFEANDEHNIEWALVFAEGSTYPWGVQSYAVINNIVIKGGIAESYPWKISYGIYDVKEDKWYDFMDAYENEKYRKALDIFVESGRGRLIGDIDCDKRLSINDATYMQQCLAKMKGFPSDDEIMSDYIYGRKIKYISDFNEDTNRDIVDVTEIQKYLAGVNN